MSLATPRDASPSPSEKPQRFAWELVKELKGKRREESLDWQFEHYGDTCFFYYAGRCQLETPRVDRHNCDIHHLDHDTTNNLRENVRPSHRRCNSTENGRVRRPVTNPNVSLSEQGAGREGVGKEVGIEATTKQIEINQGLWPEYLKWLELATATGGKVPTDWAIYKAARELREKLGYGHPKCYSADTMVLTERGWILHKDWNQERIVAYDPQTGSLFLDKPKSQAVYDYKGVMVNFQSNSTSLLVTPNHRCLVSTAANPDPPTVNPRNPERVITHDGRKKKYWRVMEAVDLLRYKRFETNVSGYWEGTMATDIEIDMDLSKGVVRVQSIIVPINLMARLIGYYVSEGSHWGHKAMRITQSVKSKYLKKMEADLASLPLNTKTYIRNPPRTDMVDMVVYGKRFYEWMRSNCGELAANKRLPALIKNAPRAVLAELFDAMMMGDGSWSPSLRSGYYLTVSDQLALDFGEIALKLGYAFTINRKKQTGLYGRVHRDLNVITIVKQDRRVFLADRRTSTRGLVPYDGKVYCFEVSTGFYVTMRNGRPTIQGNTIREYMKTLISGDNAPYFIDGKYLCRRQSYQ